MVVGRRVELQALDRLLTGAVAGRGGVVLVGGEAGIGKTTLVRAMTDRAVEQGAVVRWGASWEGDTTPFGIWVDVLRQRRGDACAAVADRLAEGGHDLGADPATGERARHRFFDDVVDALVAVAGDAPQVVVLEDVHWADPGSLQLLRAVAPRLPVLRIGVVATYRSEETASDGPLPGIGGAAEHLILDGLGPDHVASLLGDVLGRPATAAEVSAVHAQTAGNPLFVTQVGRLLASGSRVTVPTGVRDVLGRRFARVSPGCDRVLGAAAVVGMRFDCPVVAQLLHRPEPEILAALDEATAAGLVERVEGAADGWAFAHDLVRAARYDALASAERADLHGRVIDALEVRSVPASVLAHHAALARFPPDDERPGRIAVAAAGEASARFAWDDAAALARRALAAAPTGVDGDPVRAEAWLALGEARLRSAGDAAEAFSAAAEIGRRTGRPDVVARAALGFGAGFGGFEVRMLDRRQIDLLEDAVAVTGAESELRPLLLARLSVALSFIGTPERRLELADEAVALARERNDDRALAAALAARCDVLAGPDHVAERNGAASEIIALGQRAGDLSIELLGRRLRVVALLELRDLAGFDAEVAAYADAAGRVRDPLYTWWVPLWRAARALAHGRLDDAARLADEARAIGVEGGSANADILHLVVHLGIALDRADRDALERLWAAAARHRLIFEQEVAVVAMRVVTATRLGDLETVRGELRRMGPGAVDRAPKDQEWLTAVCQYLTGAVAVGDLVAVRDCYERLAPYAGLGVFEGAAAVDHGVLDRFLAPAAAALGDLDAARRHADAALHGNAGAGRLVLAHTRHDAARALVAGDDADRARAARLADEAAADYDDLGLNVLAGAARTLLGAGDDGAPARARARDGESGVLAREGDTWAATFAGTTVRVRHAKGVRDLSVLLAQPGREVHVRVLEGVDDLGLPSSPDALLDDTAVRQYRSRLRDLEDELDEADADGDVGRSARVRAERDALVDQLTAAFGLGGRARAVSDPDERLRKAVSARVKAAIGKLEALHPALGRHLRASISTGYLCCYQPERPVTWTIDANRSR